MGCGYQNTYPMIASEKMAMGFHSFYPHGIGSTDLSQSHNHQIRPHPHHVSFLNVGIVKNRKCGIIFQHKTNTSTLLQMVEKKVVVDK